MLTDRQRLLAQTVIQMDRASLQAYMMSLRPDETQRVGQVLKLYHAERARSSLLDFVTYTHHDYRPAPFHKVLCGVLDQFARRKIRRLLVSLPPQFGKSEIISRRFPAYCLGLNPHERFIGTSYGQTLATEMARDVEKTIDSPEYHDVFPLTTLEGSEWAPSHRIVHKRTAETFEIVGARGYYKGAGIGGPIAGRSATMGIIDDPFKDYQEAMSATTRQTVWNWYKSVLFTRLQKDSCICVLSTRWHKDDLIGLILEDSKLNSEGFPWVYINMPAIMDQEPNQYDQRALGEPLWLEDYPLERLREMPAYRDSEIWSALYQGRPTRQGGGIWRESHWRYWVPPGMVQSVRPIRVMQTDGTFADAVIRELPPLRQIRMSGDLSFKKTGTSAVSLGVWGEAGADSYLLDEIYDRLDFVESCDAIRSIEQAYPGIAEKLIEDKANGSGAINSLGTEVRDSNDQVAIPAIPGLVPIEPQGSKVERANRVKPFLRAGNVYLPHPDLRADQTSQALRLSGDARWVRSFLSECNDFPNGSRNDRIDQTSQYLQYRYLDPEVIQENQVAALWAKLSSPLPSIQQVKPASPKVHQYGA